MISGSKIRKTDRKSNYASKSTGISQKAPVQPGLHRHENTNGNLLKHTPFTDGSVVQTLIRRIQTYRKPMQY